MLLKPDEILIPLPEGWELALEDGFFVFYFGGMPMGKVISTRCLIKEWIMQNEKNEGGKGKEWK